MHAAHRSIRDAGGRPCRFGAVLSAVLMAATCGGSPAAPSPSNATITISAAGPVPPEVRVPVGGRVMFLNSDVRPHAMSSDPLQVHTDCPAINDVGFLNPGQSGTTGALTTARTCGFHDHTNELDPTFRGRIIVQ
jgi:plastocyanin